MSEAKKGDTVKVHYTGKLKDGSVFDSSKDRDPLEFTLGEGQLIPGFEEAVIGMEEGSDSTVDIPVDKAYGQPQDELKMEVPKTELPDDIDPQVGMQLQVQQTESGRSVPVTITEVKDETITLDANHPLAGKDLVFDIELVEIVE